MRSAVTFALLLGLAACDKGANKASQPAATPAPTAAAGKPLETGVMDMSQRGSAMPALPFQDAGGKERRLAEFKGKPVLVNLWATWCGPCVREMPSLDRLAAQEAGKLHVITINQDGPQATDPVPDWWTKAGLATLQLYRDPKNDFGFAYGGGQLPTSVLYDAQGKEVWRFAGGIDWTSSKAREMLQAVLS